ncbi:hypothetical protein BDV30DRAFT_18851 [Aspergillus minisclerotigenes]|uniref:Uncharacterized protein n=1 Tax=Aspergillus minisclerotigenes TaxID=656917 RepID=A0A5N6IPM8_9EURO|nr:hypothetical protein BDV30DRAFT_18851 [Aspergillus minisclerotigenes]
MATLDSAILCPIQSSQRARLGDAQLINAPDDSFSGSEFGCCREYITYHMYPGDMISIESFPDKSKCVLFSAVVVGPETHTELNSTPSVPYGTKPNQTGPNGTKISVVKFYSPPTPLPAVPRSRGLSDHPLQKRLGFACAPSSSPVLLQLSPFKGFTITSRN